MHRTGYLYLEVSFCLYHPDTLKMSRLFSIDSPNIDEFKKLCSQTTNKDTYPLCTTIQSNIPIYTLTHHDPHDSTTTTALQNEWHHILHQGPGVFILKNMYPTTEYSEIIDSANAAFSRIIAKELQSSSSSSKGDHFSASGKNDRIWNSFSKHALEDPSSFVPYYSNPWLGLVSEAWLGPIYRITAQVNVVKPGGPPQDPHRDYHLGFQTLESASRFPRSMHLASQFLTLQGAVAHSAMPSESGPTRFLPFSQTYESGYLAYRRGEFAQFFRENYVAVPMELGDGVFFNPALFHGAGENTMPEESGFRRSANLLQISSGLGKAMESVDVVPVVESVWDVLLERAKRGGEDVTTAAVVKAIADGYPFPTNLDKRPPAPSGMAPESEQEVLFRGLKEGWGRERVVGELVKLKVDSV